MLIYDLFFQFVIQYLRIAKVGKYFFNLILLVGRQTEQSPVVNMDL